MDLKNLWSKVVDLARTAIAGGAPVEREPPGNEPIRTRTMAQVLAGQGELGRALGIYEELLTKTPDDPDLQAEAAEVRRRSSAGQIPAPSGDADEVRARVENGERGRTLALRWNVTAGGVERARILLGPEGEDGTLAIRVIVVAPDATTLPVEQTGLPASGQTWLDDVTAQALCVAAIGLRTPDRFVSIAHTAPLRIE